jgi:hypothetical protein
MFQNYLILYLKRPDNPILQHHHNQLLRIRPCGLFQFRTTSEIENQFKHLAGLLGRVVSPSQSLCLHRTVQHRKTKTYIHALSGIRTRDSSIQAAKTHAPDRAATEMGRSSLIPSQVDLAIQCKAPYDSALTCYV